MTELTYSADRWICADGSILLLDAELIVHVSDIQVTLTEAFKAKGGRVEYWQRTALIGWVSRNQELLRATHKRRQEDQEWDYDPRAAASLARLAWPTPVRP